MMQVIETVALILCALMVAMMSVELVGEGSPIVRFVAWVIGWCAPFIVARSIR